MLVPSVPIRNKEWKLSQKNSEIKTLFLKIILQDIKSGDNLGNNLKKKFY